MRALLALLLFNLGNRWQEWREPRREIYIELRKVKRTSWQEEYPS